MTAALPPPPLGNSNVTAAEDTPRHNILRSRPLLWSVVGVTQTLLTAGIVFGWASLLPVIRDEGTQCTYCTPRDFSRIFTCGAIGNYLSTLFFGTVLDRRGPRSTALLASCLFALGLVLCSLSDTGSTNLLAGFALLGFSGPGVQMPTLHLANLFPGAVYMSAQAAAFDGGTFVFAAARSLFYGLGLSTAAFFQAYLIVPVSVFATALLVWPDTILQSKVAEEVEDDASVAAVSPYVGPATSPAMNRSMRSSLRSSFASLRNLAEATKNDLVDAPLKEVLRHSPFWTLAIWTAVHILKLNFVVASINDQLDKGSLIPEERDRLIDVFGVMLPFGFVILPVVAYLLQKMPSQAFQLANVMGVAYGAIMLWFPSNKWLLSLVVFPSVATCRQLVYSTVFHQIGEVFGFANYGTLLGLINVMVSGLSALQTPLVSLSESNGSYFLANAVLLALTVPLFFAGPKKSSPNGMKKTIAKAFPVRRRGKDEETPLLRQQQSCTQ